MRRQWPLTSGSTGCYDLTGKNPTPGTARTFRTAWFSKAMGRTGIHDGELCAAVHKVAQGVSDDLGGGVFKKRLGKNRYRGIILGRGQRFWVFVYLFAKKDRDNIDYGELLSFRKLAKGYGALSDPQLEQLLRTGELVEICHDNSTEV